jgi:formamidopyrimidine-DNA glycosylase
MGNQRASKKRGQVEYLSSRLLEFEFFPYFLPAMPELPEVEHSRRVWDAGLGQRVLKVLVPHPDVRDFRGTEVRALQDQLADQVFRSSQVNGKQIVFRFGPAGSLWLGIHLGMSGRLTVESESIEPRRHDHLILRQAKRSLVFSDQRQFGRVLFHQGIEAPDWWTRLAPPILSDQFTVKAVTNFLQRRRSTSLKAVLLMQERFPGIGNWMADEILWRAHLNPATKAGELAPVAAANLWRTIRRVTRLSIERIQADWDYPASWLFQHRWVDGGKCPRCRSALSRATIAGRTTCWCPKCQSTVARTTGRRD